jgi:hypothetical protein
LFSRRNSDTTSSGATGTAEAGSAPADPGHSKKGRPTPTRREAEAAARARAKAALDPKATRKQQRQVQMEKSRTIRQAIKEGDERYLPARDRGPVKRFIRDYVDSRLCMAEFAMPLLIASLLFSWSGFLQVGNGIMNATLIVVVLDSLILRFRLQRELKRRFPDDETRRTTLYAIMRSLQLRFMRLPKPKVKLGQSLPAHYR